MADLRQAEARGYEPRDVEVRRVLWIGAALVVVVALSAVLLGGLVWLFEAASPPAPVSRLEREEMVPPAPRLEALPMDTLEQVRRHENALLHGYGWVDREADIARIPIDRAMAILAERGWPEPPAGDPTTVRHAPPFPGVPPGERP